MFFIVCCFIAFILKWHFDQHFFVLIANLSICVQILKPKTGKIRPSHRVQILQEICHLVEILCKFKKRRRSNLEYEKWMKALFGCLKLIFIKVKKWREKRELVFAFIHRYLLLIYSKCKMLINNNDLKSNDFFSSGLKN